MRMTHKRQLGLELGLCGHQYTDLRQRRAWEGWPGVRKTTGGGLGHLCLKRSGQYELHRGMAQSDDHSRRPARNNGCDKKR